MRPRSRCACGVVSARREDVDGDLIQLYLRVRTHAVIRGHRTPHFELGQPMLIDYVWGRQVGENTINP
jgi:hypothetical protein